MSAVVTSESSNTVSVPASTSLSSHALYINRELSLLEFNKRVLAQAQDEQIPLLERLRFLCISCSNLDEFFEVRVAAVRQMLMHGAGTTSPDGMTPRQTLHAVRSECLRLVDDQYRIFNQVLIPALADQGIRFLMPESWNVRQNRWLHQYFKRELMPVLSPLGLDPVHPFPRIFNKSLNFAVELEGTDAFGRDSHMALVRAPRSLPRVIQIPRSYAAANTFVLLSWILEAFMDELFPGLSVIASHQFRVTRNSELFVDEEEVEDLARALQGELLERGFAEAVRLEISQGCSESIEKYLASKFGLTEADIYRCDGPVNLNRLMSVHDAADRMDLKYPPFQSRVYQQAIGDASLFETIHRKDILLHHPYDNFSTVVELMKQAARDPAVLAIKQTLYRTGADSVLVNLLIEAARAGKDVTVVVELRARFDEEANIGLATRLQEAGVQVVYGVVGHKTHAKMLLIVRRERNGIRRYVHLGTGNYHPSTAKAYTDIGLMTSRAQFGEDVHKVFQQLSGLGKPVELDQLLISPFTLHKQLLRKIKREVEHARAGKKAVIMAKLNSLTEPKTIKALYKASQAGVEVKLVIRGICCLRPGIKGVSENIQVISILGRFLEHARVFYFLNDGASELYCSSADWMERNLFQRVETTFPILKKTLADRVYRETLAMALSGNVPAWSLNPDGSYVYLDKKGGKTLKHLHARLLKLSAR